MVQESKSNSSYFKIGLVVSFCICLVIAIILIIYKSNISGFSNKVNTSDAILTLIDYNITKLINHVDNKYKQTKNKIIIDGIARLKNRYNVKNLVESIPSYLSKDTSYTINKGEVLAICLKDKKDKTKYHDINIIMFVTIHELAHIFSEGHGHDDQFWTNFKFLLNEAIIIEIYKFEEYTNNHKSYCGMDIKYNPITDKTLVMLE